MSADCHLTIDFHGSPEEQEILIRKLQAIEGIHNAKSYSPFFVQDGRISCDNSDCRRIWGDNYLEPDSEIYLELAKAVPNASFEVQSSRLYEGGGGGCESYMDATYKDRTLFFRSQCYVDTMPLAEVVSHMEFDIPDRPQIVVVGDLKYHESVSAFKKLLSYFDVTIVESVSRMVDCVVCNNPDVTDEKLTAAREMNIPILSEGSAIRRYGMLAEIEWEHQQEIVKEVSFAEFKAYYDVGDMTEEEFENAKSNGYYFTKCENKVSADGDWDEEAYVLTEDGEWEEIEP